VEPKERVRVKRGEEGRDGGWEAEAVRGVAVGVGVTAGAEPPALFLPLEVVPPPEKVPPES